MVSVIQSQWTQLVLELSSDPEPELVVIDVRPVHRASSIRSITLKLKFRYIYIFI